MDLAKEITKTVMQISVNKLLYKDKAISPEQYQHADDVLQKRLTDLRRNGTIRYSEVM